jgi:hypothetical protein
MCPKRNYRREYDKYHSKPENMKDKNARNRARYHAQKAGRVSVGDKKDIDHRDGNPRNNSPSNLKVVSRSRNRSKK